MTDHIKGNGRGKNPRSLANLEAHHSRPKKRITINVAVDVADVEALGLPTAKAVAQDAISRAAEEMMANEIVMVELQHYNGKQWITVSKWQSNFAAWASLGDDNIGYRTIDPQGDVIEEHIAEKGKRVQYWEDGDGSNDPQSGSVIEETKTHYTVVPDNDVRPKVSWLKIHCEEIK